MIFPECGSFALQRLEKPLASTTPPLKISTPELMNHIRRVIKETETPSWLNSVPTNFGEASAGTIKADEWRNLSTVYLPIALISFWTDPQLVRPETAVKFQRILDHTMLLVSAVCLICMRTMTKARCEAYLACMSTYVKDLKEVLPHFNHRPYHHLLLHLPHFVQLFGPVRSWWCFPFERVIGQIQRLLSNHHLGQMESTLLHSFLRAGNFKRWWSRPDCPGIIKECKSIFDKIFVPNRPDDSEFGDVCDLEDTTSGSEYKIPQDLVPLLQTEDRVFMRARFKMDHIIYSRSSTHVGNSLILFYPNGNRLLAPVPGVIKYIYRRRDSSKWYFAVQRQLPAPEGIPDPFAKYPHFPASLYSTQVSSALEKVQVPWIFSHYARWKYTHNLTVVLSLSRVSMFLLIYFVY